MLVELLRASQRAEEAHEQLDKLCTELEASGDVIAARRTRERLETTTASESDGGARRGGGDLIFLDTGFGGATSAPPASAPHPSMPDPEPVVSLIESPPAAEEVKPPETDRLLEAETLVIEPSASEAEPLGGLETTRLDTSVDDATSAPLLEGIQLETGAEVESVIPLDVTIERGESPELEDVQLAGLEPGHFALERSSQDSSELKASLEETVAAVREPVEPSAADLDLRESSIEAGDGVAELEQAVADRPEDPGVHRALAEELLRLGETERARQELEIAADAYETGEEWEPASEVVGLLVTLAPDDIRNHQRLVEFAYRSGSKSRLLEAYLALADALVELGEPAKAEAVYHRVVDHEPENDRARNALRLLESERAAAPEKAPAQPSAFVDLGSLIMDDTGPRRDTRMRVQGLPPPTDDEQRNFEETLAAFKRGIEENVELDDYHTHYDLGVAFKEMGLLDEAIAEFQKALRAPEGRLRTAEALGTAFFDKGHFTVAENLLRRAVETLAGADDEKIGLLYWLGRAREAQGKGADALGAYERALAVDIRFMDIGERVHRLGAGRP
jgi:tetratricopeptide (TPR) repeat protein